MSKAKRAKLGDLLGRTSTPIKSAATVQPLLEAPAAKPKAFTGGDRPRTKMTVEVDEELHRQVKAKVALERGKINAIVEQLLTDWVNGRIRS